jgi:hypothetical protein
MKNLSVLLLTAFVFGGVLIGLNVKEKGIERYSQIWCTRQN